MVKIVFGFIVFLSAAATCQAFSSRGHQLVCAVAYELVSDSGRALIDDLRHRSPIDDDYDSFAAACAWADQVRRTTHRETDEYHYMNVPRDEEINFARDCAAYDCVTQAVHRYFRNLGNASIGLRGRMEALLFLSHFVADLHQPLHVGNSEDRGGNDIDVVVQENAKKSSRNLHAVWDSTILWQAGLYRSGAEQGLVATIRSIDHAYWTQTRVEDWAVESFHLARNYAYVFPDGSSVATGDELTEEYYRQGGDVIREQIMKAGVRLAYLIDTAAVEPDNQ